MAPNATALIYQGKPAMILQLCPLHEHNLNVNSKSNAHCLLVSAYSGRGQAQAAGYGCRQWAAAAATAAWKLNNRRCHAYSSSRATLYPRHYIQWSMPAATAGAHSQFRCGPAGLVVSTCYGRCSVTAGSSRCWVQGRPACGSGAAQLASVVQRPAEVSGSCWNSSADQHLTQVDHLTAG